MEKSTRQEIKRFEYEYSGDLISEVVEYTLNQLTGLQQFEYDEQGRVIYCYQRGSQFISSLHYEIVEEEYYVTYWADHTAQLRMFSPNNPEFSTLFLDSNGRVLQLAVENLVYHYQYDARFSPFRRVKGYEAIAFFIHNDWLYTDGINNVEAIIERSSITNRTYCIIKCNLI